MSEHFQSLKYKEEDVKNLKYKRLFIRDKEKEAYEKIKKSNMPLKIKVALSRAMAYYPGKLSESDSPLKFSVPSPPAVRFESDSESSSVCLFKDLPEKLSSRESLQVSVTSLSPPSIEDSPPDRSPSRNHVFSSPPATPNLLNMLHCSEVECYPPTPKNQLAQRLTPVEDLSPSLARLHLAHERSDASFSSDTNSERVLSPVISRPRKLKLLECAYIRKSKRAQFITIGPERLRLSNRSSKQTVESYALSENRLFSTEIETSEIALPNQLASTALYLLIPEKFNSEYMQSVKEFCTKFNSWYITESQGIFDNAVTHVLAETKSVDVDVVDKVCFEHLQAVGYRKYLVSMRWIEDALRENRVLEAEPYEVRLSRDVAIPAAKLARESKRKLFEGVAILCAKPFKHFSQTQLEELLAFNGAKIVKNPTQLHRVQECRERYCIIGERKFYDKAENFFSLEKRLKGVTAIHYKWVYECFKSYKKEPPILYEL